MKTVLALKHRQLPPNLRLQTESRYSVQCTAAQVQRALEPWPDAPRPRCAGVNAFGFGGSNAHVVLQEQAGLALDEASVSSHGMRLLPLSAH